MKVGMCGSGIDLFISVQLLKKNLYSVRNEFDSVWFEKTRFGSDIIVIYCNSQVVNSQQILQRYSITAVLNELFVPNSVSV